MTASRSLAPAPTVTSPSNAAFRTAMSRVPTSVVVVATMDEGRPVGMVVGTFTSVSLDPLMVGFLGDRRSTTVDRLMAAERVSCNVLHESQLKVVDAFRRPVESRFDGVRWELDEQFGVPVLAHSPLVVFGRPHSAPDAGDHVLALFEVNGIRSSGTPRPLVFCGGRMTRMDPGHLVDGDVWQLGWMD